MAIRSNAGECLSIATRPASAVCALSLPSLFQWRLAETLVSVCSEDELEGLDEHHSAACWGMGMLNVSGVGAQ